MRERIERLREKIIDVVTKAGKGHLGTSLSSLEIAAAVQDIMEPEDKFISSKGHDAVLQYVLLAEKGILTDEQLYTFRTKGGLPGHPTIDVSGILANTGSLGMGLSKALGFALGQPGTVYVLLGDGEMMEGQNWEAALAIRQTNITNVTALVDYNGLSQDGPTALSPFDIRDMFIGAGWDVGIVTDGNDYDLVERALEGIKVLDRPRAIIFLTKKGKGLSNEGEVDSHFGVPDMEYPPHPLYKTFGEAVEKEMSNDPAVILVGADTLRDLQCYELKEKFPDRVFDFGIAEQNAVSFASARALLGYKPIVATYACFLRRAFEQIYNQVTEGTQVVYVGTMAGPLDPSGPGISHESLDDYAYMTNLMPAKEIGLGNKMKYSKVRENLRRMLKLEYSSYLRLLHE